MNKDVVLQEERGERILLVVAGYAADFTGAVPAAAVARIRAGVAALKALPADQKVGTDTSTGATSAKRAAINGMTKQLRALRRTFDQAKKRDQTITGNLNLPADEKDDTIVAAARAAILVLTPLVPRFVARGKKPDFLDNLNEEIADYDAIETAQQSGQMQSTGATAEIEATIKAMIDAYEDLDDYVETRGKTSQKNSRSGTAPRSWGKPHAIQAAPRPFQRR